MLTNISNLLIVINSSVNIVIYAMKDFKFRQVVPKATMIFNSSIKLSSHLVSPMKWYHLFERLRFYIIWCIVVHMIMMYFMFHFYYYLHANLTLCPICTKKKFIHNMDSIFIFQLSYKSCPLCPTDSWLPLSNYIKQVTSFSPKYIIRFSVTSSVGNLFELWNTGKKNYEMRV